MSLETPTSAGSGFLDFKELVVAAGKPVLVFTRIREFKEVESGTKRSERGPVLPTVIDVFVADGPDVGDLYEEEEIIGAPTGPLRGVKNPGQKNGWKVLPAVNKIGVTYPFVVKVDNYAGNDYAQLDTPKGSARKRAEEIYGKCGGDEKIWSGNADLSWLTAEDTAPAEAASEAAQPLGSGPFPWGSAPDSAA